MSITTPTDYTGVYKITVQKASELQEYIDSYETHYLARLFGVELYEFFNADLNDGVPQTARFTAVFDSFLRQDEGEGAIFYIGSPFNPIVFPSVQGGGIPTVGQSTIRESKGIKDMLKGFVYFEFNKNQGKISTPAGIQNPQQDASKATPGLERAMRLTDAYNRAIESYQSIQWFMLYGPDKADYPEYDGIPLAKSLFGGVA